MANFGSGSEKTRMHKGKKLANVSKEQLDKSGLSLRQYMNQWNKTGSRPTGSSAAPKARNTTIGTPKKTPPKGMEKDSMFAGKGKTAAPPKKKAAAPKPRVSNATRRRQSRGR